MLFRVNNFIVKMLYCVTDITKLGNNLKMQNKCLSFSSNIDFRHKITSYKLLSLFI